MNAETGTVETVTEIGTDAAGIAKRWITEIKLAEKDREDFLTRANKVVDRFVDERRTATTIPEKRYNCLWSYQQTMQPSVYSQTPKVQVDRRFYDSDPISRVSSTLIERCEQFTLEDHPFDEIMFQVRDDMLLVGRGQAWVRYEADFDESGLKTDERTVTDYIHYSDYLHNPARNEQEVRWKAKRVYKTRDELKTLCGGEKWVADIPLDFKPKGVDEKNFTGPEEEFFKKAVVWELWDKTSRTVYWICPGYGTRPLKVEADPLKLRGFFPCPRAAYGTLSSKTLQPIPEFTLWQDQADQLDEVMLRRKLLTEALRVSGIYDASCKEVARLLQSGGENILIPVENWTRIAQGGGLDGSIQFIPLLQIADTLRRLGEEAQQLKEEIYELTGWSDVMRGTTNPYETRGAQEIKSGWAATRLKEKQREMQRFARDVCRIHGEIIAEHFEPQTIADMAGVSNLGQEDDQLFMQAIGLMKNDKLRSFRISIETDSTLNADEQQEREGRIAYLGAITPLIEQMTQIANTVPQLLPFCGEAMLFATRTFKASRSLEEPLEQGIQEMIQHVQEAQAQQAQDGPPPDPNMVKAQAQAQALQMKTETQAQALQMQTQAKIQQQQADMQSRAQREALDAQLSQQKAQQEAELEQQKAAHNMLLQRDKQNADLFLQAQKIRGQQVLAAQQMAMKAASGGLTEKGSAPKPRP